MARQITILNHDDVQKLLDSGEELNIRVELKVEVNHDTTLELDADQLRELLAAETDSDRSDLLLNEVDDIDLRLEAYVSSAELFVNDDEVDLDDEIQHEEIGEDVWEAITAVYDDNRAAPSDSYSSQVGYRGNNYAVLRNSNGVIAVFEVTETGAVTELRSWPLAIEDF